MEQHRDMKVHTASKQGVRKTNEDHHCQVLNNPQTDKELAPVNFFAVYDGHGGPEVSKYLYDNLSTYFTHKELKQYPLASSYIKTAYNDVQNLLSKFEYSMSTGSTACVVVNYTDNKEQCLQVVNLGDSRCVICRSNFAIPLTKDHKPHWPEEIERISAEGGKITFDGIDWRVDRMSVSRAFGDRDTKYVSHEPDIFRYKLTSGDKFLVIACDGLWDVMNNEDVVNFILLHAYSGDNLKPSTDTENIACKLAAYAIEKLGSQDNVSVIIVFL